LQGCGFRDLIDDYRAKGAEILGVSFDTVEENRAFAEKFSFPFPLLSDTERAVGLAYGACDDASASHAARITYVIGSDGKIAKAHGKVDPATQPTTLLTEI